MKTVKLSTWAKDNNYTYHGAYRLFKNGGIPSAIQYTNGTILVPIDNETSYAKPQKVVTYARVSTPKQKNDLETQSDRLSNFCITNGYIVTSAIKEVASGLNDDRPKLNKILSDDTITHVVVENKDRLTRFGFNYIEQMLTQKGIQLIVCNRSEQKDVDLMQDFVSIITSMAARVYGTRRFVNKKQKLLELLEVQSEVEHENT